MNEATKENLKHYGKEAIKIGIAVAAGVAAYKIYENYKDSHDCYCDGNDAIPNDGEYNSICNSSAWN